MEEVSPKSFFGFVKIVFKEKFAGNRRFQFQSVKTGGSLARNARFGSFLGESSVAEKRVATSS